MEDFPDELLLRIFSFVADGVTLLDAVPLVCKRWHRLARDPEAWRGVDVHVEVKFTSFEDDERSVTEAARIILHAPALRSVRLNLDSFDHCELGRSYVFPALDRCRAVVRELHLNSIVRNGVGDALPAVLGLLWRSKDHLRALSLDFALEREERKYYFPADGDQLTALGVLAGLQRLEELQMGVFLDRRLFWPWVLSPPPPLPSGFHLPRLRRLALVVYTEFKENVDPSKTLPVQLVLSCADSLRHLQLHVARHRYVSLAKARLFCEAMQLARCASLRSLTTDVRLLAALGDLHQLHTLRLDIEDLNACRGDELKAVVGELRRARAEPLRALRRLALRDASWCFDAGYLGQDDAEGLVEDVLAAASRLAANATVLVLAATVVGASFLPFAARTAVLDGMPGLREVFLDGDLPAGVVADVLPLLQDGLPDRVPDLRAVAGRALARDPEQLARCEQAVASFRRRRPDVEEDISLSLLEYEEDSS